MVAPVHKNLLSVAALVDTEHEGTYDMDFALEMFLSGNLVHTVATVTGPPCV